MKPMSDSTEEIVDPMCEYPDCAAEPTEDVADRIGSTLYIYWVCEEHVGWAKDQLDTRREDALLKGDG